MALFRAGEPITAEALNKATQKIVARGQRVTASSGAATTVNVPVMRIDGAQLYSGFTYKIEVNPVALDGNAAGDTVRMNVYYTIDGSTATTASTQLGLSQTDTSDAATGETVSYWNLYTPSSDVIMSALLSVNKPSGGAGNVTIQAGTGATGSPIEFLIINMGEDVGDTATEL